MKHPRTVLLLGKLPPPAMGPAIATQILLNSELKQHFRLLHLDTRINTSLSTMGRWSPGKLLRAGRLYVRLMWLCLRYRPSLVLVPISQSTTGFLKDAAYVAICRLSGRKVLLQLRGSQFRNWYEQASPATRLLARGVMHAAKGVIVLGQRLRSLFEGFFPPEKIFVIPNGGDFSFPEVRKGEASVRFLFLSNLFAAKGILDVLAAFRLLVEKGAGPVELHVAGAWLEASTRREATTLVDANRLPVTFLPSLTGEAKMKELAAADVFVFPPRAPEGHPWVIVEAMAAGLPVIATDQGAISESVRDGENGYIVEADSPPAIAAAMQKLAADANLRQKMASVSRKLYLEHFTEKTMTDNYIRCFETCIADG
jgi:glycosyltransferase involved in cell wall biosynthesis